MTRVPTSRSAQAVSSRDEAGYLCRIDEIMADEWEHVVAGFDDAVIDQTWAFARACWGESKVSTAVLYHEDTVVAACLVVILRPPLVPGGIAHVKFGPLLRRRDSARSEAHATRMLRCLRDEYVVRRGLFLRVMPQADAHGDRVLPKTLAALQFAHTEAVDEVRYLVNLSSTSEQLRASLKSKWRSHLKKAESEGLQIEHGTSEAHTAEFLELYASMRTDKSFADDRALGCLAEILHALPETLAAPVWLCRDGEQAIAAAVVAPVGDTALYWFGASNQAGRERRAGFLLHWAIANNLRDAGCRWYDLGGACDNAGLRQFKAGLTGRDGATPRLPGQYDLAPGPISAAAARSVFWLRDAFGKALRH